MKTRILAVLCLGLLASGCAAGRGIVDVRVPETVNPETKTFVKIVEVKDRRFFQVDPPSPSIPSLKDNEINDEAVTSRAIARKRNSYGMALGDILLPPDKTVSGLVREALASALKDSGYTVVSEGDPGYDSARTLNADIMKFWSWMNPGMWEIKLSFEAQVVLSGDWPVDENKRDIYSTATAAGMAAGTSLWEEVFNAGVSQLIGDVKGVVARPPG